MGASLGCFGNRVGHAYEVAGMKDRKTLFPFLNIQDEERAEYYDVFRSIDEDFSMTISLEEFHNYFGFVRTPFSDRAFGIMDLDNSGALDFYEFVGGVWNVGSCSDRQLMKVAFDIFDLDGNGTLDFEECAELLRMIHNSDVLEDSMMAAVRRMDSDGDGALDIADFLRLRRRYPSVTQPAFQLREILWRRMFGRRYWKRVQRARMERFGSLSGENILRADDYAGMDSDDHAGAASRSHMTISGDGAIDGDDDDEDEDDEDEDELDLYDDDPFGYDRHSSEETKSGDG
eukprot:PLAT5831.1.p1 GENE.PLAT5831.1~~PLAT5831.1.p1  ORF type:complete len:300 (+),score=93.80 PLAT5831.1:39-902(+)